MAFYENTIIAKQDLAENDLKTIRDIYFQKVNKKYNFQYSLFKF